ncbi:MAG: serine hydrolase [Gemmatimonadales bacterium]
MRKRHTSPVSFLHAVTAAALLLPAIATGGRAQAPFPPDSALRSILDSRVSTRQAMGIVVATLERGKPPHIYTAGISGISGLPLDGNTVFEIGSITKVFTNTILADMVRKGEVKLDDPISKYLPKSVHVPQRNGKQITLLDLATQSSGLPRLPTNLEPADVTNPYADYTVKRLYDFLSSYVLPRDIGSQYEYSNLGMGILGHVLALRAGKSYEALVKERVLIPLGMHDSGITLSSAMKSHIAQGFGVDGSPMHLWDLPTLAGAGALRSTANDMLKFLAANLDSASLPLGPAMAMARAPRKPIGPNNLIGLAWNTVSLMGLPVTWHNGGTGGFRTFIGIDSQNHRGVIVLTNSTNSPDDIGFHILQPQVPLAVPPAQPKVRTEVPVDAAKLDQLVGVYELAPAFRLTITKEGGSLFAQATGQDKVPLFAQSETEFFLKVVDAQVTFVKDADGKVNQLILHQGGANLPGRRVQ